MRAELGRLNEVLSNELAAGPRAGVPVPRNTPAGNGATNGGNGNGSRRHGKAGREEPVSAGR